MVDPVFALLLKEAGVPLPHTEYEYHHQRAFRADFCWPDPEHMLILEVQGGVYSRGKHGRASGILKDYERLNAAAACGYRVLQVTPQQLRTDKTIALIREALNAR